MSDIIHDCYRSSERYRYRQYAFSKPMYAKYTYTIPLSSRKYITSRLYLENFQWKGIYFSATDKAKRSRFDFISDFALTSDLSRKFWRDKKDSLRPFNCAFDTSRYSYLFESYRSGTYPGTAWAIFLPATSWGGGRIWPFSLLSRENCSN